MKTLLIFILVLMISFQTLAAGITPQTEFILKNAHDRGFFGCDKAISKVFENAGGQDVRVVTDWFNEFNNDSLRMMVAYGGKGDTVLIDADFRKKGSACFATATTILTFEKSCTAYLSEMNMFKYQAETGDIVWTENPGKVNMILKPVGSSCLVVYENSIKR